MRMTTSMSVLLSLTALSVMAVVVSGLYSLKISNNGPACFDSELTFIAKLTTTSDDFNSNSRFLYMWINNVEYPKIDTDNVTSDAQAMLTKTFTDFNTPPHFGEFNMTVRVFNLSGNYSFLIADFDPNVPELVAEGANNFSLTDKFKIGLDMKQDIVRRKSYPEDIFIAGYPIILTVHVNDHFVNPVFSYNWQINGQKFTIDVNNFEVTLNSTIQNHLEVSVDALLNVTDFKNETHRVGKESESISKEPTVKDLVTDIKVDAKNVSAMNSDYRVHVTCRGSSPFTISWNITGPLNKSAIYEGIVVDLDACDHVIGHNFLESGSYFFTITIENPVDIQTTSFDVDVILLKESSSIFVYVLCAGIGLVLFAVILWAYFRTKNRTHVEMADFQFYSLDSTTTHPNPLPAQSDSVQGVTRRSDSSDENRNEALHENLEMQPLISKRDTDCRSMNTSF